MKIIEFLPFGIETHSELNPSLWKDNQLTAEVKEKLIAVAKHFRKYVDIDFPVIDVIITGGQTNKYYTKYSDLDLHIITDYDRINCDKELSELFDTKRLLYKEQYNIKIKGIPVELYVEDSRQFTVGGAYSIIKDKWLRPSTEPNQDIDHAAINKLAMKWYKIITNAIASKDLESLEQVLDRLKEFRKKGLRIQGEYGIANLTFKSLRNSGIVDQLRKTIIAQQNQKLSIK
jgi:hypothetical protein